MKYINVHIQNVLHEYKETHNKVHHSSTNTNQRYGENRSSRWEEGTIFPQKTNRKTAELSIDTTCSSAHGKKIFNVLQENTANLEFKTQPKKINK